MNLQHFFRLILIGCFQDNTSVYCKEGFKGYDRRFFFCPRIICKDGFNISLQINNGNYCSTENGYQEFGWTFDTVEFGYPNMNEEDLKEYSENENNITETVGRIPVNVIEKILEKHNYIDWDKTLSKENCKSLFRKNNL